MKKNFINAQGLMEYILIFGLAAIIGTIFLSPAAKNTSIGIVNASVEKQDVTVPTVGIPTIANLTLPTEPTPTTPTINEPTTPTIARPTTPEAPPCPCPGRPACGTGSYIYGTEIISGTNCSNATCPRYRCNPCSCPSPPSCSYGYTFKEYIISTTPATCTAKTCTIYDCAPAPTTPSVPTDPTIPPTDPTVPVTPAPKEVSLLTSIDMNGSAGWEKDNVHFFDLIEAHIDFTTVSELWAKVQSDFQSIFSASTVINLAQRVKDSFVSFFGYEAYFQIYTDKTIRFNPYDVTLMDKNGNYFTVSWNTFTANTKVGGTAFNTWSLLNGPSGSYENDLRSQLTGLSPSVPSSWINLFIKINKTLYPAGGASTAVSSVQNLDMIYTDPSTGDQYRVNTGFFSPVKVSLTSKDARINSDHRFLFDLDGFKANSRLPIVTAGGLNPDEAWLINDRSGNSLFNKGALDGEDIFGDHLGKYKSGYEDLAQLYSKYIKTDEHGKRYIELKSLSLLDRIIIVFNRIFRVDNSFNPSYDLKLITRENKAIPAAKILSRIYVDYDLVNEFDKAKLNWIGQRATVVYKNGEKARSADQWFQALTLTPIKSKNLKKK